MFKPVLSIDISKSKSFAASFLSHNQPFTKPFSFNHSQNDMKKLVQHLNDLEKITNTRPDVVLEATGNFSKPIVSFFEQAGYNVVVLNPIMTHQLKAKSIRKIKTDPVDANRIAQVYYLSNFSYFYSLPEDVTNLRNLCRQYDGLNCLYAETQLRLHSILDLIFPNYHTVFNHLCCKSSLELLYSFSSPNEVLSANKNQLIDILKSSRHSASWIEDRVDKLMAAANDCLPNSIAQHSNIRVLKYLIELLMTHRKIMDDLRADIIAQAKLIHSFNLINSIPGVGELTAAMILSEIGDVNRFQSAKQLIAFAGLDPSVFQSGKFKADNSKISKRGSCYLRKALYQATAAGIAKRKSGIANTVLYEFYSKKLSEGKTSKVSITAASSKLLRIIYGVLRNNQCFISD